MDRANALDLMLADLEGIAGSAGLSHPIPLLSG
jgi:hypothetical protein